MTPGENQTTADRGGGIEIVRMPTVLDLTTSEGVICQLTASGGDRIAGLPPPDPR
jgi:hypothetical protein